MKINSTILAAAIGLASVSLASATQYVYYTGSTAARDAIYNTLIAGKGFDAVPTFVGFGSSTPGNCSYMEFSNTVSGTPTIVKCEWSGSEAGIADVSGSGTEYFLLDPGQGSVPTSGATATAPATPNASYYTTHTVDMCQADNDVAYSKIPNTTATENSDSLVIPFVFVKAANELTDNASFVNLTSDNFKCLAQGGEEELQFTGLPADTNYWVYLAGRDDNSGTRVNCFGETGWGIKKSPLQIELSGLTPNTMLDPLGNGSYQTPEGQSSGGTLAKSLTDTTSTIDEVNTGTAGLIAVAYLGLSDDATAEGSPYNAVRLTYNGVAYTPANVESGLYAFWGNEYTDYRSGASSIAISFVDAIIANVQSYTSSYEIPFSAMGSTTRSGPLNYPVH
jgi:hypothetical protein